MNWDEFWRKQLQKNETGTPKFTVYTDPDTPEEELICAWIEKWQDDFVYFYNGGCGCCINIYEFDAPPEAVAEIPADLVRPYRK